MNVILKMVIFDIGHLTQYLHLTLGDQFSLITHFNFAVGFDNEQLFSFWYEMSSVLQQSG